MFSVPEFWFSEEESTKYFWQMKSEIQSDITMKKSSATTKKPYCVFCTGILVYDRAKHKKFLIKENGKKLMLL